MIERTKENKEWEWTRFSSGFPNLSTYTLNPGRRSSSTYASCRLDASLQYARKTDIASVEIFTKETDIRDAISANPLNYGASRVFPATFTTRRFLSIPVSPPSQTRFTVPAPSPSRIPPYDQFREIISVVAKVRHLERPINPATTHFVHVLGVCLWPVPTERPIL